jgi:putative ABC transport system ATP-binding protein
VIHLRGVEKAYGAGDARVMALAGVNLDVARGEFVALMGPSGSGKSTTLNVLGCLDLPTAGTYHFRGIDVTALDRGQRARLRREWIGFVFQGFHLLPHDSALENVELPLVYRGASEAERRTRALEVLDQVGLADRVHHLPSQLSGGQQQRVAIARALVTRPEVLLADEPTGNLDSARSAEIVALLRALHRDHGQTLVMVTHEPDVAAAATRIVTFRDGRIAHDSAAALQRTGRSE